MRCPSCNAKMQPLLTGMFCPNDCDRQTEEQKVGPGHDNVIVADWAAALEEWFDERWDITPEIDVDATD